MICPSPIYNILLIDDDPNEFSIIKKIVAALTVMPICIEFVTNAGEAVSLLDVNDYDLVLLDNRLSRQTTAESTAPLVTSTSSQADIAIISYNIDLPYLHDTDTLSVDYVIDKTNMV